ncbi:MAG: anhydro-N-acetylmuramic acid kinase [Ferruginibacter sp.]
MIYRVIGVMSGSPEEGIDIIFTELIETGGKWNQEIIFAENYPYTNDWKEQLNNVPNSSALQYQRLHMWFGRYIGQQVNNFIGQHELDHRVHLVVSHGYTVFHLPGEDTTAQLGNGAYIAAETKLPVVSDLLSLDMAFGGKAAPMGAIAEKLLSAGSDAPVLPKALVVALMGILRWREERNMDSLITGAKQDSIGGALWLGTEG